MMRSLRQVRLLAVAAGLAVAATACFKSPAEVGNSALDGAAGRWRLVGPRDYSYTVRLQCFCATLDAVDVTVQGGVLKKAVVASTGVPADTVAMRDYLTIDRMFAYLKAVYATGPAQFDAVYEATLGYPVHVDIDRSLATSDDDLTILVWNFQPTTAR